MKEFPASCEFYDMHVSTIRELISLLIGGSFYFILDSVTRFLSYLLGPEILFSTHVRNLAIESGRGECSTFFGPS